MKKARSTNKFNIAALTSSVLMNPKTLEVYLNQLVVITREVGLPLSQYAIHTSYYMAYNVIFIYDEERNLTVAHTRFL